MVRVGRSWNELKIVFPNVFMLIYQNKNYFDTLRWIENHKSIRYNAFIKWFWECIKHIVTWDAIQTKLSSEMEKQFKFDCDIFKDI